ncbi:LPS translocon maturation chaperone LptM [Hydrogenophaga sp. SL48]|uniref:LPS translocon maturation chaperone LptM n=1 Tax=Hydrogenophaga sp. SL48 TaxID=2806347 RepID=UPI002351BEB4|nr:lipoprotein [Hydrogenophaga sp. SL48]UJW81415.1 lipoprotein [Hydrogenophaga sp. SL48]
MLKKPILGGLFSRPTVGSGIVLLAAALMASGCGQKGPLYLPPPASAAAPRPTATPAVPPLASPSAVDPTQSPNSGTAR